MRTFVFLGRRVMVAALALALMSVLSGCVIVKPWQRAVLTKSEMKYAPDALDGVLMNHIYFAKEAATGGDGAGGGGCGCN